MFELFFVPVIVLTGIIVFLLTHLSFLLLVVIVIGSIELVIDTARSVYQRKFALDYIAIVAILTGIFTGEYLVAAVIVLMLAGGNTLEKYGVRKAKSALTKLTSRIPHSVTLALHNQIKEIATVTIGEEILVRKGEVIPLDGSLVSDAALIDESSLTGEVFAQSKHKTMLLRSGTINIGNPIIIRVRTIDKDSTYRKIIAMVELAQQEKSPLIRIADRYSVIFTIITFTIVAVTYALTGDVQRVLAILVLATPCPLILATPIALMGGVNAAASRRIIIKSLSSLEVLSRVKAMLFDKTGTLTLGKPELRTITILDRKLAESQVLALAAGLESQSLHPLAKAILREANHQKITAEDFTHIQEKIGEGISGINAGKHYHFAKFEKEEMVVGFWQEKTCIATFAFADVVKPDAVATLRSLQQQGMALSLYTGDENTHTQQFLKDLGLSFSVHTHCTPEDKQKGIHELQSKHIVTAMIGDGINDAPALAAADVGMVFSNEEQTASSEAADIVFLNGNLDSVSDAVAISHHTLLIATQSIFFGIGLSIIGMVAAAFGFIPPITGALLQEVIDVAVILNALRASTWNS
ncbi:MAG: heavy metal translocating P-type ATPase [Candidatus Woesebacteria bacterium]